MTAEDIQILEAACRVGLPGCYATLLLRFPAFLNELGNFSDESVAEIVRYDLIGDLSRLLELNSLVGNPAKADWLPSGDSWPEYLFVIGENGGGDYYLIDTRFAEAPVLQYSHDGDGAIKPCMPSLALYLERIQNKACEYDFWESETSYLSQANSEKEKENLIRAFFARSEKERQVLIEEFFAKRRSSGK